MKRTRKNYSRLAFTTAVIGATMIALMAAPAAYASQDAPPTVRGGEPSPSPSGTLDPLTYEGSVIVATTKGDVLTTVNAGELPEVAASIRARVADGTLDPETAGEAEGVEQLKSGGCHDWANAVAGAWSYAESTTGCAVIGYPGYDRVYNWSNKSGVQLCVQAKGFKSPGGSYWAGIGCQGGKDFYVPWGNTFAYTQVRGQALSWVTGAAYTWWD
ncbi:hypothetical protein N1027_11825 [Herbiconiux sp. CPCC 205763]|uniref:Secreted protein n=1 Tax=Herbiconiux aconitum TaxID=2970913 RepID=A0ABT2GRL6_9MICO|nr:hypothetical protein [Herbiconiux aconitum]MCS5718823.1 hypothetical protein [Herbiconiux aconitum]